MKKNLSTALSKNENGTNLLSRGDNITSNRASRSNSARANENLSPRNIISRTTELARNSEIRDISRTISRSISNNSNSSVVEKTRNDNRSPNEITSTDILRDASSVSRSISRSSSISDKNRPLEVPSRSPSVRVRENSLAENFRDSYEIPSRDSSRTSRDYYESQSRGSSIDPRDRSLSRDYDLRSSYRESSRSVEVEDRGRSGYNRLRRERDSSSEDDRYRSASVSRSMTPKYTRDREKTRDNDSDYRSRSERLPDKGVGRNGTSKAQMEADIREKLYQAERQKMVAFMMVAFLVGILYAKWFLN